jgi:hypothetical protein
VEIDSMYPVWFRRVGRLGLLLAGLLTVSVTARAGGGRAPAPLGYESDPAFDRYVDLNLLARAWADKNAALLADLGLQLAEGERILFRPHRAVSADQVLTMAIKLAAEKREAATLARLSKALEAQRKADLAGQAAAAHKLASVSRAPDNALKVQAGGMRPEIFLLVRDTLASITAAKVAGDRETLDIIIDLTPTMKRVPEAQRKYLLKVATEARNSLPKDATGLDPAAEALDKLLDDTRGRRPGQRLRRPPLGFAADSLGVMVLADRNGVRVAGFTIGGPVELAKGAKLKVGDVLLRIGRRACAGNARNLEELVRAARESGNTEVLVYERLTGRVRTYELPALKEGSETGAAGKAAETPPGR